MRAWVCPHGHGAIALLAECFQRVVSSRAATTCEPTLKKSPATLGEEGGALKAEPVSVMHPTVEAIWHIFAPREYFLGLAALRRRQRR